VLGRFGDHTRAALYARELVQIERFGHRRGAFERSREHGAIFDRHARALCDEGQRGVRGIAEQRHALRAPVADRLAIEKRPAVALVPLGGIDERLDLRMPAGVRGLELLPRAALGPRFLVP